MTLMALIFVTCALVLLPMLPALNEWWRPSDVTPLPIDGADAQDPYYLERQFISKLRAVIKHSADRVGGVSVVSFESDAHRKSMPLSALERAQARTERIWHTYGELALPKSIEFSAEVASMQDLQTGEHGRYRALWSGGVARLAPHTNVQHWVHANVVQTQGQCHVGGRITATERITLGAGSRFSLLHAPLIEVLPASTERQCLPQYATRVEPNWPPDMYWDAERRRGRTQKPLELGAFSQWEGDVVCQADCRLGENCEANGSLKVHGTLRIEKGSRITGNVFARGPIVVGDDCVITGMLVSEKSVHLGAGSCVGSMENQATLSAPSVVLSANARVHGTVWAENLGETLSALKRDVTHEDSAIESAQGDRV